MPFRVTEVRLVFEEMVCAANKAASGAEDTDDEEDEAVDRRIVITPHTLPSFLGKGLQFT